VEFFIHCPIRLHIVALDELLAFAKVLKGDITQGRENTCIDVLYYIDRNQHVLWQGNSVSEVYLPGNVS
jgi:hypothetical protein